MKNNLVVPNNVKQLPSKETSNSTSKRIIKRTENMSTENDHGSITQNGPNVTKIPDVLN